MYEFKLEIITYLNQINSVMRKIWHYKNLYIVRQKFNLHHIHVYHTNGNAVKPARRDGEEINIPVNDESPNQCNQPITVVNP
jgi:hypothetical protein